MKRTIKGNVNLGKATFTPLANVKQLDDIILELDIYSNSVPLDITEQTISLYAKRSNKTTVEQLDNITKDTTRVTINVKNSCFAILGITEMELRLVDDTGSISTSTFYITVDESLSSKESINANNEIAILDEAKKEEPIRQANEDIRVSNENTREANEIERTEAEELRKQNEIAREASYKEITDARVDFDGATHDSLNERLTQDMTQVMNRFNNASLLDYSGEYITAQESYEGRTEELSVGGNTLQNLLPKLTFLDTAKTYSTPSLSNTELVKQDVNVTRLKPSTVYTLIYNLKFTNKTLTGFYFQGNYKNTSGINKALWSQALTNYTSGNVVKTLLTIPEDIEILLFTFLGGKEGSIDIVTGGYCMILEGDWTNKEIPNYFEGIRSAGETGESLELVSCGKNLFNNDSSLLKKGFYFSAIGVYTSEVNSILSEFYIKIDSSKNYVWNGDNKSIIIMTYDANKNVLERLITYSSPIINTIKFKENVKYVRIASYQCGFEVFNAFQFEEGTISTSPESYQEHRQPITLTTPLRGLPNGIRDIVDFERGVVVRNVGKVVLNGSENWVTYDIKTNTICFKTPINYLNPVRSTNILSDKFNAIDVIGLADVEGLCSHTNSNLYISIFKSKLTTQDVAGFKAWLQANSVTVYYQLATPIEEPIANLTQLRTYDKVTNVFTSGSLINPTITTKIPTNVNSVIKTLQAVNARLTMVIQQNSLNTIALSVDQEARLTKLELGVI